jgi:hypothetical protein
VTLKENFKSLCRYVHSYNWWSARENSSPELLTEKTFMYVFLNTESPLWSAVCVYVSAHFTTFCSYLFGIRVVFHSGTMILRAC